MGMIKKKKGVVKKGDRRREVGAERGQPGSGVKYVWPTDINPDRSN